MLTAHQALERLGLRGGESLFVGGGAGGVGHLAIQLAAARGARVVATASEGNHDFLRELGAEPLDYADGDVPEQVARAARRRRGGRGARPVRRRRPRAGVRVTAPRRPPRVDRAAAARAARGHHEVSYVFVRPSGYDLGEHVTPLVAEGSLRVHVEETFPLERAADAHERIEGGHVRGKLVLTVD